MAEFVYVDNSNVFIEGKRVKAVATGRAPNIYVAQNENITDPSYKIDFGRLHYFIAGDDESKIKRCMIFGSRVPKNDSIWDMAKKAGFEIITEQRNFSGKEKKIDTGIVMSMSKDAYTLVDKQKDTITLASGDSDFVPLIKTLVADGFKVDVAFWSHASRELREACSNFIELNEWLDFLSFRNSRYE
ncbi:MAG: NYN domain-containing protein [Gammaproteobacteria bacterium]|nr:NYN domain-containing protein [Gammaproteobacteria bacterium]MDA7961963.1 NYN domain-containing protein [Gammaproteobacteria bacterium]MDA7967928.1 NYN domain-containing protein [Gammaproteobacteria bacterium]MDA7969646.1 NYN domain-containing protein [Gammaproteobacteria bacterium]MDA7971293.1 NYN domain-containing protein [Gammaproteobacteria bacterium]